MMNVQVGTRQARCLRPLRQYRARLQSKPAWRCHARVEQVYLKQLRLPPTTWQEAREQGSRQVDWKYTLARYLPVSPVLEVVRLKLAVGERGSLMAPQRR